MAEIRTFAEISLADSATVSHGLSKAELEGFAAVSGDFNPTHLNKEMPGRAACGAPTAHGMWTASLISSVLGNELPGAGTVYVRQDLHFHAAGLPGRCGDGNRYRDRQGAGRQLGALRLPLHQPEWRGGARRHGRGARADEQGRDAVGRTGRPSASRPHDGYEELLRRAAPIPAISCASPTLRQQLPARGHRGGRGQADHAHPGRPPAEDPASRRSARDRSGRLRDGRRADGHAAAARPSSWCAPAGPSF